jgi:hypothetical protein
MEHEILFIGSGIFNTNLAWKAEEKVLVTKWNVTGYLVRSRNISRQVMKGAKRDQLCLCSCCRIDNQNYSTNKNTDQLLYYEKLCKLILIHNSTERYQLTSKALNPCLQHITLSSDKRLGLARERTMGVGA